MEENRVHWGGIRRRWLVNSLGGALLIVIVSLTAFVVVATNYYYESIRADLAGRLTTYINFFDRYYLTNYDTYYQYADNFVFEFRDKDKLELQFINAAGRLELSSSSTNSGHLMNSPDVLNAISSQTMRNWVGNDPYTRERILAMSAPLVFNNQVVGVMRAVTSLRVVDNRILQTLGISALVGILFVGLVSVTNLVFIRSIVNPLREINKATKRIAAGGYGTRIEKKYNDEIGELADNINHMSGEIRSAERMKNDFISSVSHELRTPLTAISGWGETLLSTDMSDTGEIKKAVRIILKENARLSKMVEELLDFTRMEGGRITLDIAPMDVREDVEEIVYMRMEPLRRDGIELTMDSEDEIPSINGDRARLNQVFVNIMDNAVKHGGDGERIEFSVYAEKSWVCIAVRDYGQGILPEELPHVRYKFYKGTSVARGSGIGLAVCDEIIRLHEGEMDIESIPGEGTLVTIRLPANPVDD